MYNPQKTRASLHYSTFVPLHGRACLDGAVCGRGREAVRCDEATSGLGECGAQAQRRLAEVEREQRPLVLNPRAVSAHLAKETTSPLEDLRLS